LLFRAIGKPSASGHPAQDCAFSAIPSSQVQIARQVYTCLCQSSQTLNVHRDLRDFFRSEAVAGAQMRMGKGDVRRACKAALLACGRRDRIAEGSPHYGMQAIRLWDPGLAPDAVAFSFSESRSQTKTTVHKMCMPNSESDLRLNKRSLKETATLAAQSRSGGYS
jgi:hypothetical protein